VVEGYFVRNHVITSRASTARTTPPTTDASNCVPVSPVHSNRASNMAPILGMRRANHKMWRGVMLDRRPRGGALVEAIHYHSEGSDVQGLEVVKLSIVGTFIMMGIAELSCERAITCMLNDVFHDLRIYLLAENLEPLIHRHVQFVCHFSNV
jgi:hypothetical protein